MVRKLFIVCIAALTWAMPTLAGEAPTVAEDPALEARVTKLSEELRCLVCQNQSLADSHAELAQDLKNQVREMLKQGMTEQQVVAFLVQRYGDFVLYRPPVKSTTWLLWLGPFLLLIGGLALFIFKLKRRRPIQPLTPGEHAVAEALLGGKEKSR
ncbi:MAG: cytochrome c-type biogenesis protein CcmH [Rhodocyclaceae bacterium]|nr:cytochrome c-type biogenesis protein CcmH [Rhodocyclaceae bacterium]